MQATQILPVPASPNSLRITTMPVWFFPLFNKHSFEMYSNTAIKIQPLYHFYFYFIWSPCVFTLLWNYLGGEKSSWQKQVLKLSLCILRNKQLEMHIMNYNCFLQAPPPHGVGVMYVTKFHSNSLKVRSLTLLQFFKADHGKKEKKIKWNKYKIYTKYLCQIKVFKMLFLTHPPCPSNVSLSQFFFLSFFHNLLLIFTYLTMTISSGVGNSVYIFKVRAWAPKTSVCSI